MALPPTRTGDPRVPSQRDGRAEAIARIRSARGAAPAAAPATPVSTDSGAPRTGPQKGYRLKTATTDAEIERQIRRLMQLIANDNIDPDAPPGSYLNMLL